MKIRISATAALILALSLSSIAHAANFCLLLGTNTVVVASGLTVPAKGTCAPFNGYFAPPGIFLLTGDICKSSDGSAVLFNLFTQFQGQADSLAGKWTTSTGKGLGNECFGTCHSFTVTVTKCPANIRISNSLPPLT